MSAEWKARAARFTPRKQAARRPIRLESLERRDTPAVTAGVSNFALQIDGTDQNDQVTVQIIPNNPGDQTDDQVWVRSNGQTVGKYSLWSLSSGLAGAFQAIEFRGFAGSDRFEPLGSMHFENGPFNAVPHPGLTAARARHATGAPGKGHARRRQRPRHPRGPGGRRHRPGQRRQRHPRGAVPGHDTAGRRKRRASTTCTAAAATTTSRAAAAADSAGPAGRAADRPLRRLVFSLSSGTSAASEWGRRLPGRRRGQRLPVRPARPRHAGRRRRQRPPGWRRRQRRPARRGRARRPARRQGQRQAPRRGRQRQAVRRRRQGSPARRGRGTTRWTAATTA